MKPEGVAGVLSNFIKVLIIFLLHMAVKNGKNKKVLSLIAWVILSAKADNITGKFETKARILAKRQHSWLLAS